MAEASIDIERVVQEVLRELRLLGAVAPQAAAAKQASPGPAVNQASPGGKAGGEAQSGPANDARLVVSDRVVTMSLLDGRLQGVRKLVVARGSIVTPAVHDELHRRSIAFQIGDSDGAAAGQAAGAVRLVLVAHGRRFDPSSLVAAIKAGSIQVAQHAEDCIMASADLLAAEVAKPNTLGAVLTRHTAAALCLANRLPGVRAVLGLDAAKAAAAAEAVGANVLVADPAGGSFFWLKQMIDVFCRAGVRTCPEVFEKRLK
jgi:hypothetical protein